jgi:hypothetical protein
MPQVSILTTLSGYGNGETKIPSTRSHCSGGLQPVNFDDKVAASWLMKSDSLLEGRRLPTTKRNIVRVGTLGGGAEALCELA